MMRSFPAMPLPRLLAAACAALACAAAGAQGQGAYPRQPITIVVPYAEDTVADHVARRVAKVLAPALGQEVEVDNRPGAGGVIGAASVAEAPPDGYTLMIASTAHVVSPSFRVAPYDPVKDFAPVAEIAESPQVIVTAPSLPVSGFKELAAYLESKGTEASYSSPAVASTAHLCTLVLQRMIGTSMRHVAAGDPQSALEEVAEGEATLTLASVERARPMVAAGKLKAIAQTGRARSPLFPDVPTLGELGYPDYRLAVWVGMYAPANTPRAIVERLNRELRAAFGTPEARAALAAGGFDAALGTPEQLGELTAREYLRWAKVIKAAGIGS